MKSSKRKVTVLKQICRLIPGHLQAMSGANIKVFQDASKELLMPLIQVR